MTTTHTLSPGDRVEFRIGPSTYAGTITSINPSFGTAIIDYGADAPYVESIDHLTPITSPQESRETPDKSPSPDKSGHPLPAACAPEDHPCRLHIAAMAMQGLLAGGIINNSPKHIARHALSYADALINEHINTSK